MSRQSQHIARKIEGREGRGDESLSAWSMSTASAAREQIAAASGVRSTLTCGLTVAGPNQHIALRRIRRPPFDVLPERVARDLHTSLLHGLSAHDVQSRLVTYGKNVIYEKRKFHIWSILWRQIANAITFVLVVALVISFAVKDYPEGGVIAAFIAANLIVGFFHEYRAEWAMNSLKEGSIGLATVIRRRYDDPGTSEVASIPLAGVTIGDIIKLQAGQIVPADVRLFRTNNLQIDESLLTGESLSILKDAEAVALEEPRIGDCLNLAYSATTVTKGTGYGIVYAIGMNTEAGKIAEALKSNAAPKRSFIRKIYLGLKMISGLYNTTVLQKKLATIAHFLFISAIILVVIVFGIARFKITTGVALYAISLALAIIPESLSAVVTITIAKGITNMARHNAIVRRLDAIEALGRIGDICCDKTGTLTTGKMVVRKYWNGEELLYFEGGDLSLSEVKVMTTKAGDNLFDFLPCIALCNNAAVFKAMGAWQAHGEATEVALQICATKLNFVKSNLVATLKDLESGKADVRYIHTQEYPFNPDVKRMTVVYLDMAKGTHVAFMKGAPESVISVCTCDRTGNSLSDERKKEIIIEMESFAEEGLRVLALATRELGRDGLGRLEAENEMTFLGLIGLSDPPRAESANAIESCRQAGITVHMLTGDHISTAVAIAKEVHILPAAYPATSVLTAEEFDGMTKAAIDALPELPLVIARCSPQTKVRMVDAIHRRSRLTAMTGDGINDTPSIKSADVGIAMGLSGSDVARQAAEMVLADDNFATVVTAIQDGRRIFDNQMKFILYLMSSNCAEVIVLVAGLGFLDSAGQSVYPLSPVQVLWENLITSAFPAFALGLEAASSDVMNRPPIDSVFKREFAIDIIVYGVILGTMPLLSFVIVVYAVGGGIFGTNCGVALDPSCEVIYRARAIVFVSLTILLLLHSFEMKDPRKSMFRMNLLQNKALLISVVGGLFALVPTVYIPKLNETVFKMLGIGWEWSLCGASIVFYIIGAESYKAIKRRFYRR